MTNSPQIEGRTVKILIVDDEEIVLSLARDALEDAGYETDLASDGQEALYKIKKQYFDFILTDIRMPGINGLELARQAREIITSIGIIFMTGYANLNTAKDAIKEGAYDYIMKPFELNELRQAVKNAVSKKQKDVEKTLSSELDRLSDLNQLMYTVSDRKSLMRLSLGFAMMQGKAEKGSIIFRNELEFEIGVITTAKLNENKFEESAHSFKNDILGNNATETNLPVILESIEDHPIYRRIGNPDMAAFLAPQDHKTDDILVSIAIKSSSKLYGYLILGYPKQEQELRESELKLLSITASQIAISLENIILLEESRDAYNRLQELQDQTLQLERMATKGQMSAEIGHELNNYLGVIMGNLSLMRHHIDKKNYDELGKYFEAVSNNLYNIKKFTDGLIDVSKLRSKFEECNIISLIEKVIEYLKAQNRFADITIAFEKPNSHIISKVDTGQLQQLLYNLLNNSADAINETTDNREKQLKVAVEHILTEDKYILTVIDNGVGIDEYLLKEVFIKRFSTKKSGHGFGLLVCSKIIEHHKGQLNIKSTKNIGTEISISFPIMAPLTQPEPVS